MDGENTRLLVYGDLASLGVTYHADTLRRKVRRGEFPAPVDLSPHRIAWPEDDIRSWLASRPTRGADWQRPEPSGGGEMVAIIKDNSGRRPPDREVHDRRRRVSGEDPGLARIARIAGGFPKR